MVIKTELTEMFGIKHPIILAPMGPFYITELCTAVSDAGGLGVLSHTNLFGKSSLDEMKANMEYVVEHTDKPFGFNIRTARMQPDAKNLCRQIPKFILSNPKIREQCVYAITSAGSPRMLPETRQFKELREKTNIKHIHVSPADWLAQKSISAGVDAIVVTGTEGGGHQSYEKVSTLVLIQEIKRKFPDIPIIACGGFGTGVGLAAAIAMGAGAVAMGSRFIASNEAEFNQAYKDLVPAAKSSDTEIVTGFLGPIRLYKNNYSASHGLVASKEEKMAEESGFSLEDIMEDQKKYELIYKGNVMDGAVLLGQSIGLVDSIDSVSDIIETCVSDAEKLLKTAAGRIQ
jgi:NAD(P)H-dependent flavin oxidoreductase YrpB (nitropropane dioxygenase family)